MNRCAVVRRGKAEQKIIILSLEYDFAKWILYDKWRLPSKGSAFESVCAIAPPTTVQSVHLSTYVCQQDDV